MTHVRSAGPPGNAQKGGRQPPFPGLKPQPTGRVGAVIGRHSVDRTPVKCTGARVPSAVMYSPLPALKGAFASVTLALNTVFGVTLMFPFALAKALLPFTAVRHVTDRALNTIATGWISINNAWIDAVGRTAWDVQGIDGLDAGGWYLVSSNHQSWVDILVLQKVFNRRIPMLKFFLKRELIWVPVIGLAWWALDFPFMQRRGGASGKQDLERARKACEKFRLVPTSVINFLEGTRFTKAKHDAQDSPYVHLLKPKVGGIATAVTTLGSQFHLLLDVTIVYPGGPPDFWTLLSGQLRAVTVRVQQREIPAALLAGDYISDPTFRGRMQEWINSLWSEKDELLGRLKTAR
jgi:1-acyl-sn-glycerol-3-phosphate acyltransferase